MGCFALSGWTVVDMKSYWIVTLELSLVEWRILFLTSLTMSWLKNKSPFWIRDEKQTAVLDNQTSTNHFLVLWTFVDWARLNKCQGLSHGIMFQPPEQNNSNNCYCFCFLFCLFKLLLKPQIQRHSCFHSAFCLLPTSVERKRTNKQPNTHWCSFLLSQTQLDINICFVFVH